MYNLHFGLRWICLGHVAGTLGSLRLSVAALLVQLVVLIVVFPINTFSHTYQNSNHETICAYKDYNDTENNITYLFLDSSLSRLMLYEHFILIHKKRIHLLIHVMVKTVS